MASFDLSDDQLDASALAQLDRCSFLDNLMLSYLTVKDDNVGDIELSLSSSSSSSSSESGECDEGAADKEKSSAADDDGGGTGTKDKTNLNSL